MFELVAHRSFKFGDLNLGDSQSLFALPWKFAAEFEDSNDKGTVSRGETEVTQINLIDAEPEADEKLELEEQEDGNFLTESGANSLLLSVASLAIFGQVLLA